ncbi:MAG: Hpt domain-containing protein [Pseudomonadota bacterium]|nr:Hpt domain-containing protein [Pseudomonadota bacterium]
MSDAIDTTTLGWIKPELDETLRQARQEIEAFAEAPTVVERMRVCANHLHQVHGTLRMVELNAPAMIAEEMERLALSLQHGEVSQLDEACAVLMRGVVQLPDYLERLQGGHRDIPIVLLPLLNELRAARGEPGLGESVLFAPNLDRPLPDDLPMPKVPASATGNASPGLAALHAALAAWPTTDAAVPDSGRLSVAIDGLLGEVVVEPLRRMLWVASSVASALRDGAVAPTLALRGAFAGVETEIRQLLDRDFAVGRSGPAVDPTRELLYHVANSDSAHPALDDLRRTFQLESHRRSESEIEHARGSLSGRNRALLDTVSVAIKDDLLRVKDALDLYLRTGKIDIAELLPQVDALGRISDTLGMMGLGVARGVVVQQRDAMQKIVSGERAADESALLEIAGALLYVDGSLDEQVSGLGLSDDQTDEDRLAGESRKVLDIVVREAIANFGDARQSFVAFVETGWDHAELCEVPRLLDEVSGALRILNLPLPARYLTGIRRYAQNELINGLRVPSGQQLDTLADALASIEYYLEALRDQRPNRDRILDIARHSLEALRYWPLPDEAAPEPSADALAALAPVVDGMLVSGLGPTDAPVAEAASLDPFLSELPPVRPAAEISTETPVAAPPAAVPVTRSVPAGADGFEHSDDIDDEIREVFLEELEEEISNLGSMLPSWRSAPDDPELQRSIRRVFHTLKGSGRLVGAKTLGEFSWKIEDMLNRVLDGTRNATPAVLALVERVHETLPQLHGALQGSGQVHADLKGIEAVATRLAAGEEAWYTAPAVPAPIESSGVEVEARDAASEESGSPQLEAEPQSEVEPEGVLASVDPVLLEILGSEVSGHLQTIEHWISGSVTEPQAATESLQRAIHTLNGAFAMTEVPVITEITAPTETYVRRLLALGERPGPEGLAAITAVSAAIASTLAALQSETPRVPIFAGLASRMSELRDTLPPVRPAEIVEEDGFAEYGVGTSLGAVDLRAYSGEDSHGPDQGSEAERAEAERAEAERAEAERAEAERAEAERAESERAEAEQTGAWPAAAAPVVEVEDAGLAAEAEQIAAEQIAAEQIAAGEPEHEAEHAEAEQAEPEQAELEQAEPEQAEPEQAEPEHAEPEHAEPEQAERAEAERLAEEEREYAALEAEEAERLGAARVEAERLAEEEREYAALEAEYAEADRVARELAMAEAERERVLLEQDAFEIAATESGFDDPAPIDTEEAGDEPTEALLADGAELDAAAEAPTGRDDAVPEAQAEDALPQPVLDDAELSPTADADETDHAAAFAELTGADPDPDQALDLSDLDPELVDIFVEEGVDLLDHSDGLLAQLRARPSEREPLVGLQRDLHTLKGGARMAGIMAIGELGHVMESLLESVVEHRRELGVDGVPLLERGFDRLHAMVTRVGDRRAVAMPQTLIAEFEARSRGQTYLRQPAPVDIAFATDSLAPAPAAQLKPLSAPISDHVAADEDDIGVRAPQEQVRIRADLLDRLVNYAGEVAIYRSRLEQQLGAFRGAIAEMAATNTRMRDQLRRLEIETEAQIVARYQREADSAEPTFDPLELDRFSNLQQLSRALSESAADQGSLQVTLDDLTRQYETLLLQQSRVSSDLQEGLMRTRMVPFDGLLPRLRRVVRQAAGELGKQVQLKLDGSQGELDRNVLERMTAPLEHMLRNAVAHGLETPEQRLQANKPEEGTVSITIRREGSEVVLEVADDGRGLDREAIRRRGEERGLISGDAVLIDADLDALILEPGFSTADSVSRLAGRGVGMDVVASEVRQLGGTLDIQSNPGKGLRFTLRLPQTLAVTQAVFVRIGDTSFAVPIASVRGVGRIARDQLNGADGEDAKYVYGGEDYAVRDLGHLIGHAPAKAEGQLQMPVLLIRAGDLRAAVTVDQVVGSREIVVKSVGPQVASVPGIFGATIMGDGSVVVILDVAPLVRRHAALPRGHVPAAVAVVEQRSVPLVMVVDDSVTMRKVTGRVLERHNFAVATAKDGVDALERMADVVPDLMLLDIEMPRMDGYELATLMKADPRLRNVPIVMITSRTGEKHRQRAFEIGVERYLGKPYQEPELMRNVFEMLGMTARHGD